MGYATVNDVKFFLPNAITTEGSNPTTSFLHPNPESIQDGDVDLDVGTIEGYIAQADQYINGELAAVYQVPLVKVNNGGIVSYPAPIPSISARLAAKFIWEQRLTGADKAAGDFIENHYKQAMIELNETIRGNRRLLGQNGQVGSRFSRDSWHQVPPYPAKEPPQAGQI